MKKYYILLSGAMLAATLQTKAQTKIGGTGAPDGSAMLEVTGGTGNNKGILPPRLTTAQRDAISLPAKALMIYNTTANQLQVNTGTPAAPVWTATNPTNVWSTVGNAGTNPATNFIGTTDNQSLIVRTNALERVRVDTIGRVGIGDGTPRAPLSFASTTGSKIRLWDNGTDTATYGFGIGAAALNYHIDNNPSAAHRFLAGGSNGDGTELMRIQSNGNVGIGTSTPSAQLDIRSADFGAYGGLRLMDNGDSNMVDANMTPGYDMITPNDSSFTFDIAGLGNWVFGDHVIPGVNGLNLGRADRRWSNYYGVNANLSGTMRITGSIGTPTTITGRNATGDIGNVGIGTGLSLTGGVLSATPATPGWDLAGNTGSNPTINYIGTADGQPLIIRTNATERMRVQSTGNIGIATNFPQQTLHVEGTARVTGSSGTPTAITGRNATGDIGNVSVGTGLNLAGGVLSATPATPSWALSGNTGTSPATNYIGTTDAQPLAIRTNGTEKVRILPNGKMGIGTNNPSAQLDIRSADFGAYGGLRLMDNGDSNMVDANMTPGYDMITPNDSSFTFDITGLGNWVFGDHVVPGVNGLNLGRADRRWNNYYGVNANLAGTLGLGIATPNYKLDVAGDINASANVRAGGVVLTSDARLKRNISNTQHGLSTVMALRPVEYEKKNSISESVYNRHEIGFIAQEIRKVLPSVVTEGKDADKTLAVSYTELIPVLTKAIQEQQAQIDDQNTQIKTLKAENQKLKSNEAVTAQLMERVKQMEQMMGIKEIEGSSKVAGK
ncbi:tail fiber domain-containing protein [Taibaiella koreensis]|uniref:tail fiber domain-containing protein n=1 Tax=Taibaiella koreensis TaxID=1268548 RepID=UPI000E59F091|nr:tail fiber domain-containing protein [Taibaiella koreensis]